MHYVITNHIVESCFKKHGYTSHWKQDGTINQYATTSNKSEEQSGGICEAKQHVSHGFLLI